MVKTLKLGDLRAQRNFFSGYVTDHRILPQFLFACTSGKGGEEVEALENIKLEKNLRKTKLEENNVFDPVRLDLEL